MEYLPVLLYQLFREYMSHTALESLFMIYDLQRFHFNSDLRSTKFRTPFTNTLLSGSYLPLKGFLFREPISTKLVYSKPLLLAPGCTFMTGSGLEKGKCWSIAKRHKSRRGCPCSRRCPWPGLVMPRTSTPSFLLPRQTSKKRPPLQ